MTDAVRAAGECGNDFARGGRHDRIARLRCAIDHASHLLPAQGPITGFVHHNTLHAFEDLPFDEAVKEAARTFGAQPYLSKRFYRDALEHGRIRLADLEAVLREDLGRRADEPIRSLGTRLELRLAMLRFPLTWGSAHELRWFVSRTDALARFRAEAPRAVCERLVTDTRHWVMRDHHATVSKWPEAPDQDASSHKIAELMSAFGERSVESWTEATWESFTLRALWRVCRDGVNGVRSFTPAPLDSVRHRDRLLETTGLDADEPVNEVLIRFCAAFLDQGLARTALPDRELGLFHAFCTLYRRPGGSPARWMRGLRQELARLQDENVTPLDAIAESLDHLGVAEMEWDRYLAATLLSLRGWAGMLRQVGSRGDRVACPIPEQSHTELLAVRLLLDRLALGHISREVLGFTGSLSELRAELARRQGQRPGVTAEQRAFAVFQLAQLLGWTPQHLYQLPKQGWWDMLEEIEEFPTFERRRVFHLAYERCHLTRTLDAISARCMSARRRVRPARFQAIFCIDDREESFRRHLEELSPEVETFGLAGFFNVPMYFKGAGDAYFFPLCPIVIRPRHWVIEEVTEQFAEVHRRRAGLRRLLGGAIHSLHLGTRAVAAGTVLSATLGVLASVPLVARVLFPRLTSQVRRRLGRFVEPPPPTRLRLERDGAAAAGPTSEGLGYTVDEMTDCTERILRDIGLTSGFGRLVLILGHGSTSLNNPHISAYGCGACSGASGGPNARAAAQMLSDPRVRDRLRARGIAIPQTTAFLGGLHNTCNDHVALYDLDRLQASHADDARRVQALLDEAGSRNAHERCRRFMSAPLALTPPDARRHVEERSEDLAQPRPELGHVTNAVCVVGRRDRTCGLFMDRRAFLVSYDPTQDDSQRSVLLRLLQAAVPVCAGINLEYLFSCVDPDGYGCGTKLPHNITSLLGVMDGAASDLRTGLPVQMVEIHEPVRLLFVIEATAEALLALMERDADLGRLCRNAWVRLAVLDPDSAEIQLFEGDAFRRYDPQSHELPHAASSAAWYRGWRDNLDYAAIGA